MNFQLAEDFKYTDYFNSFREDLAKDFVQAFEKKLKIDFFEKQTKSPEELKSKNSVGWWSPLQSGEVAAAWKVMAIKYIDASNTVCWPGSIEDFPTAHKLINAFGDGCPIGTYSMLEAHSEIQRHTGIENTESKYVRCQIPLIVPDGDIGLEVDGHIIRWDNVFAFNNQIIHSAWNRSAYRRLIFTIDLERHLVDWPEVIHSTTQANQDRTDLS